MTRDHAAEESVPQGTEFDFEAWALESKLSKKTCTQLKKEELTVSEAIEALSNDDITCLGLPLGQAKLLTKAVNRLQQTEKEKASPPRLSLSTQSGSKSQSSTTQVTSLILCLKTYLRKICHFVKTLLLTPITHLNDRLLPLHSRHTTRGQY